MCETGRENTPLKLENVKSKTGANLNDFTHVYAKTLSQTDEPKNIAIKK